MTVVVIIFGCDAKAAIDGTDGASPQIDVAASNGAARGLKGIVVGSVRLSWVIVGSSVLFGLTKYVAGAAYNIGQTYFRIAHQCSE